MAYSFTYTFWGDTNTQSITDSITLIFIKQLLSKLIISWSIVWEWSFAHCLPSLIHREAASNFYPTFLSREHCPGPRTTSDDCWGHCDHVTFFSTSSPSYVFSCMEPLKMLFSPIFFYPSCLPVQIVLFQVMFRHMLTLYPISPSCVLSCLFSIFKEIKIHFFIFCPWIIKQGKTN